MRQLFPTMPIDRLNKAPARRAVLADLTCDSDGKMDQFIDLRDVKHYLELHPPNGEPYYIASFLVGAYQEILGDLHNLFGDTDAVHVRVRRRRLPRRARGRGRLGGRGAVLRAVLEGRPRVARAAGRRKRALRDKRLTMAESGRLHAAVRGSARGLHLPDRQHPRGPSAAVR